MRAEFLLKRNFRHLANSPRKEIVKNHHVSSIVEARQPG
jgi:hypothetical protein